MHVHLLPDDLPGMLILWIELIDSFDIQLSDKHIVFESDMCIFQRIILRHYSCAAGLQIVEKGITQSTINAFENSCLRQKSIFDAH